MNLAVANNPIQTLKTLRADPCYLNLAHQVKERAAHEPVHYFPSPGNWGDSLINAGASEFFEEFAIAVSEKPRDFVKTVDPRSVRQNLAIVGGGGGWNRNWSSTIEFVEAASRLYRSVVVLPSTFDPELLKDYSAPNVLLASRAQDSSMDVADLFCHDMAFFLRGHGSDGPKMGHPLISLRRDKERHPLSVDPDRNWDISLLGNAFTSHSGFLDIIARFNSIYTDRLHIAILGGMLGAQVRLFEGNYGKNLGVYAASLQRSYPTVQFTRWAEFEWSSVFGTDRIGEPGYETSGAATPVETLHASRKVVD